MNTVGINYGVHLFFSNPKKKKSYIEMTKQKPIPKK
jgi:hypothetical protein